MKDESSGSALRRRGTVALTIAIGLLSVADPAAAQVVSGSFVGDGVAGRRITGLGFRPDLVLVKGNDYQSGNVGLTSAVMRTSTMSGDLSKPVVLDYALIGDQITSIDADGFTLGSDRRVAQSGITFHWAAFKATAVMKVGTYTGDGAIQSVTTVGFQPDFVIVMSSGAARAIQACSATPAGRSYEFDISGWLSTEIVSLDPTGFTVNHDASLPYANASGVVYHYVAWDASPGLVSVGKYNGTATDKNVLGVGFRPEFLFVKFINNNLSLPDSPAPAGPRRPLSPDALPPACRLVWRSRVGGTSRRTRCLPTPSARDDGAVRGGAR
jgi:hypothetical protein